MIEEWKDIEGYENKYQISSQKNVRSLNYNNTGKIKELKQKKNRFGYMEVKLSKNNKTKNYLVSTLYNRAFMPNSPKTVSYNGKQYKSYSEMAKDNNVKSYKLFCKRMSRGWSLEDALEIKTEQTKNKVMARKFYEYNGAILSVRELAKKLNMPINAIRKRLSRGWTTYECEMPLNKKRKEV